MIGIVVTASTLIQNNNLPVIQTTQVGILYTVSYNKSILCKMQCYDKSTKAKANMIYYDNRGAIAARTRTTKAFVS